MQDEQEKESARSSGLTELVRVTFNYDSDRAVKLCPVHVSIFWWVRSTCFREKTRSLCCKSFLQK